MLVIKRAKSTRWLGNRPQKESSRSEAAVRKNCELLAFCRIKRLYQPFGRRPEPAVNILQLFRHRQRLGHSGRSDFLVPALIAFLLILLTACQPSKNTFLKDVALNYHTQGFLAPNIFQVSCNSYSKFSPEVDDITDVRERFLEICRLQLVKRLAEYKIRYDFHIKDKLESNSSTVYTTRFLQITFDYGQLKKLKKTYGDLLPGFLISEKRRADLLIGTYRIKRPELIEIVQNRDLPFKIVTEDEAVTELLPDK